MSSHKEQVQKATMNMLIPQATTQRSLQKYHRFFWDELTQKCSLYWRADISKTKAVCLKRKRTIQNVIARKFKSQHLGWYGGVLVLIAWVSCTSLMLESTYRFHNIFCQPDNVFFRDVLAYSSQSHILLPSMAWLWSAMCNVSKMFLIFSINSTDHSPC